MLILCSVECRFREGSGGALRTQARKPGRREGGFAAWGRAARSGVEVRFAAFARRRPRGPVLRTLPRLGHERRFAAHENPRNPCSGITPMLRCLRRRATRGLTRYAAEARRRTGFRGFSCRAGGPFSCPGAGRGPKDRPAWPTGGAERSRSAKSGRGCGNRRANRTRPWGRRGGGAADRRKAEKGSGPSTSSGGSGAAALAPPLSDSPPPARNIPSRGPSSTRPLRTRAARNRAARWCLHSRAFSGILRPCRAARRVTICTRKSIRSGESGKFTVSDWLRGCAYAHLSLIFTTALPEPSGESAERLLFTSRWSLPPRRNPAFSPSPPPTPP